ncbi:LamG domain-containing protein [Paucibacter sp. APW11]|uniref:LamG domain-containing protein n=1 Tax=Roseateles aquae TaxID=3077235 RepID=A0ABU3P8W7_9BURK|nr:LamG domain-containing protein [Paucibacter sp. APW11]MDT8998752.1 LamG domain-containing protein [Paucibacter sp. APW11]
MTRLPRSLSVPLLLHRWRMLLLALLLCLGQGVAQACTMSIDGLATSPASPTVGSTVTITILVTYQHCQGGALQFGDDAPARLSYSGCAMQSTDWDCNNVYNSGGQTYSVYVPGNTGIKSAAIDFSYTATSTGSTTITFTEYISFTSQSVTINIGTAVQLKAEYRFDECSNYSGAAGEVKASTGGAHATAVQGAANTAATPAIVNRHADLRAVDGRRYFSVSGGTTMNSDWSVSVWVKFPLSTGGSRYHVLGAMSGGGDLMYMDASDSFRWGVYTNGGSTVPGSYKFNVLSSGWHHIVLVATPNSTELYVDGAQKDAVNARTIGTLAYIGASYDIDAGTHEGLNAEIDEFMVFSGALSAGTISSIYSNQAGGKNYDGSSRANLCPAGPSRFVISGTGSASTCTPQTLTITAVDSGGATVTSYTGSINLSTSSGKGNWSAGSGPAPAGTLSQAVANSGAASYSYAAGDSGSVKLRLDHGLAQTLTVTVVDPLISGSSSTSASISFSDNAFVFAEDLNNKISSNDVAVAGRPHDYTLSYMRKDPVSGTCGVATDYAGSHALKFWRSDNGSSWTAPTVVSPALNIPSAAPVGNNLTLNFTAGVASFNLGSSDIGRYSLNARDDSLSTASTIINGSSNVLTVRPFALILDALSYNGVGNAGGSTASSAVFAPAGASFSATLGAYRWTAAMTSNGADPTNTGTPDSTASAAALKAGGLAPGFASAVTLAPLAGTQLPFPGTLGSLSNGSVAANAFSSGSASLSQLQYSEVGSFAFNTAGVASNFLGSGQNLGLLVLNASGQQNARVGRFVPAGFKTANKSITQRVNAACPSPSSFTYLGENLRLNFDLSAVNLQGNVTSNYSGSYAKLDLNSVSSYTVAGIQGSTMFKAANNRVRLASKIDVASGWSNGQATGIGLTAALLRAAAPDGPFATVAVGVAVSDGEAGIFQPDLDTDSPANGADSSQIATVELRFGRLRLQNAIGSQTRTLALPVQAQHFDGSNFVTNTLDSCTSISASQLSFGNFRKTLDSADAAMQGSSLTLSSGVGALVLAKPASGHAGSYDVAISLGANAADNSCLKPWTPAKAASSGAGRDYLQTNWCGNSLDRDPAARASFGLYRGSDAVVYQRENY